MLWSLRNAVISSSPRVRTRAAHAAPTNRIEPSRLCCAFEIMHYVRLADGLGHPSPRASRRCGGQATSSARWTDRGVRRLGERAITLHPRPELEERRTFGAE